MSASRKPMPGQLDFDGTVLDAQLWREAFERRTMHPTIHSYEQVDGRWERIARVDESRVLLGWVCPSCDEVVDSPERLRWDHEWDPDRPGRKPDGGWCETAWEKLCPRWCALYDEADTLYEEFLDAEYERDAGLA